MNIATLVTSASSIASNSTRPVVVAVSLRFARRWKVNNRDKSIEAILLWPRHCDVECIAYYITALLQSAHLGERRHNQVVRWPSSCFALVVIQATSHSEVRSLAGRGFHVLPVDSQAGGAQEPQPVCLL